MRKLLFYVTTAYTILLITRPQDIFTLEARNARMQDPALV